MILRRKDDGLGLLRSSAVVVDDMFANRGAGYDRLRVEFFFKRKW